MVQCLVAPPDFRVSSRYYEDLEGKISSLKPGEDVDVFVHPSIGRGVSCGEGDYSDAVTQILDLAREYCLELAGGRERKVEAKVLGELVQAGRDFNEQINLIANAIQLMKRKDDLLFKTGPIVVSLYRDYDSFLGRYLNHSTTNRMVAEIEYIPFGSEKSRTIGATDVGFMTIHRR